MGLFKISFGVIIDFIWAEFYNESGFWRSLER